MKFKNPLQAMRIKPGMSFRDKAVVYRRQSAYSTISGLICVGSFAYLVATGQLFYIFPLVIFTWLTIPAAADVVRKTRALREYDSRPDLAYLVEIRNAFGVNE